MRPSGLGTRPMLYAFFFPLNAKHRVLGRSSLPRDEWREKRTRGRAKNGDDDFPYQLYIYRREKLVGRDRAWGGMNRLDIPLDFMVADRHFDYRLP